MTTQKPEEVFECHLCPFLTSDEQAYNQHMFEHYEVAGERMPDLTPEERIELEKELREQFPDLNRLSQEQVDEIVTADAAGEQYFIPSPGPWKWEIAPPEEVDEMFPEWDDHAELADEMRMEDQ